MSPIRRASRERGVGLIEVLVAVLVLSIGLLGLAQLQVTGLKSAHSAGLRLEAVNLAYDVLERMRTNRTDALQGDYNVAMGGTAGGGGTAQTDTTDWQTTIANSLPDGKGQITVNPVTRTADVTVQWVESWDQDAAGAPTNVIVRSQL